LNPPKKLVIKLGHKYYLGFKTLITMKKSIKLTALALLISACAFAAKPQFSMHANTKSMDHIVFYTLPSQSGIDLRINKINMQPTMVVIRDSNGNILWSDKMKGDKDIRRGYNLTQLDEGDYSIEITSGMEVFKRNIHIYHEGSVRSFIVEQVA
jgi:hypothetical protein